MEHSSTKLYVGRAISVLEGAEMLNQQQQQQQEDLKTSTLSKHHLNSPDGRGIIHIHTRSGASSI